MSIYVIAFLCTLIPAVAWGIYKGGDARKIAVVLALSFFLAHGAWASLEPMYYNCISDLFCAAIILVSCTTSNSRVMVCLFIIATGLSLVNGLLAAPSTEHTIYFAWMLSILGHAQNIFLFWIEGDAGPRVKLDGRKRTRLSGVGVTINRA